MTRDGRADQRLQDLLEGRSVSDVQDEELDRMKKLVRALEPKRQQIAGPSDQFKRRLRSELLAAASATEEDAFAAALSDARIEAPDEVRPLVAIASALEPATLPQPDPSYRFKLRATLLEQATAPQIGGIAGRVTAFNTKMKRSFRAMTAMAMASALLAGSGAAVAASANSIPGDTLYGVKRLSESARLVILSGEREGRYELDRARTRLSEVGSLADRASTEEPLYIGTLDDMDRSTTAGATILLDVYRKTRDEGLTDLIAAFTTDQIATLSALVPRLPAGVRPAAEDSLRLVERTADELERVVDACDRCPSDPLLSEPTDRIDSSGSSGCDCAAAPSDQPSNPGVQQPPSNQPGPGNGGSGSGGDPDGDENRVDVPDQVPDEVEDPLEDLINDVLDEIEDSPVGPLPLPTLTPVPSLPSVTPPGLPTAPLTGTSPPAPTVPAIAPSLIPGTIL